MGEIIDINNPKRKKEKKDLILPLILTTKPKPKKFYVDQDTPTEMRSCTNCRHYGSKGLRSCGHYPNANFFEVSTKCCNHEEGRPLWSKKPGLLRRIREYLFD